MSDLDIVLDPMAILQMTAYHEKIYGKNIGATFGLIYGQQVELNYHISFAAPLASHQQTPASLIQRFHQYDRLRLKRSKSTVNFYEQYSLLGAYLLRPILDHRVPQLQKQDETLWILSDELIKHDAPYTLLVDANVKKDPQLFRRKKPCPYKIQIKKNERLCLDSLHTNNSNELELLQHSIEKKKTSVQVFTDKIEKISSRLNATKEHNPEVLRQLEDLLNNYDRICAMSEKNKKKAIEAMNYNVVTGLLTDKIVNM